MGTVDKQTEAQMNALEIFWKELQEVTVDNWTNEELEDCEEYRIIVNDVNNKVFSESVIKEAFDCLERDWCVGKTRTAFMEVVAKNGGFDKFDSTATYSRKPKTKVIDGIRWIVG